MTPPVSFYVAGEPKGQPRPRAFARKMGNGKFVARVFEAGTAEAWKGAIAAVAERNKPTTPFEGPVSLRLRFFLKRPNGHYVSSNPARGIKPNAPAMHTGKPDADNLAKAVMDALTQCGWFWRDDAQVALLFVAKNYGNVGTGALIDIMEVVP